jgi:hypothetical protein
LYDPLSEERSVHRLLFTFSCALAALAAPSCQTGVEAFAAGRLLDLCDGAYYVCNFPAGCTLDQDHYAEGSFPGVRRVVLATTGEGAPVQVRLYFTSMIADGTQLLVQMHEPDCTIDKKTNRVILEDVDLIDEIGDDRLLIYDFKANQEGEHLIEVFSDMSADYLIIADTESTSN